MSKYYFLIGGNRAAAALLWNAESKKGLIQEILIAPNLKSLKARLLSQEPTAQAESCAKVKDLGHQIELMFVGQRPSFKLSELNLSSCTPFQQQALMATFRIPRGRVSTYQKIAAATGSPQAARAVGNAMANNPFPIVIPCHRTIKSDLSLGGFGGGSKMKQHLLALEGIAPGANGRIPGAKVHY